MAPAGVPGERTLVGRERELAALEQLLMTVRDGGSGSLVIHGDPGIGKSALLERLTISASEFRVVRAVGVEGEVDLPYAGLHQLCRSMMAALGALPDPQCQALQIVLGLSAGEVPDRYLVALAVLNLFSEAAATQPLLCVVDDAQWLDVETTRVLAFVARRLGADTVALVIASRTHLSDLEGLPSLHVHGLARPDAGALLDSIVMGHLDGPVRERFLAETHGNPLALLELPHAFTPAEVAAGAVRREDDSLSSRIEDSFRTRLVALPEQTRQLLLLAAAEPLGDPLLLTRAAARLGLRIEASDAAQQDGLVEIRERCAFRHPLVRSAVYRGATPEERRQAHAAIADATDRESDPDRHAWHRANATASADEEVAGELERSAARAQARGGLGAAAAFLERSVSLSADPARRAERALAAAQASLTAGAFDAVGQLLAVADGGPLDELQRARAELLRAQLAFVSSYGSDAPVLLLSAAKRLEPLDLDLARETYLDTLAALVLAGRAISRDAGVVEVSRAARAAPPAQRAPTGPDLMLDGLAALYVEGRARATPILRQALHALTHDTSAEEALRWLFLAGVVAVQLWEDEEWRQLCLRYVELGREVGALSEIPLALTVRVYVHVFCGELGAADALLEEMRNVTEATGMFLGPFVAVHLAAMRGREAELLALIEASSETMMRLGQGAGIALIATSRAILYNGLGRYDDALVAAREVGPQDLTTENWAISELIEAAVRAGSPEIAADGLRRLHELTEGGAGDWGLGLRARCEALLSEGEASERLFEEAITRLARTRLRPELARAHLLYGEWLRREGRRVDARDALRTAHDNFAEIGMEAFAERARRELAATGETARKRTDETRADLTAQEAQIARLAVEGLTNPQIGAQLFLSPRTVEWHLRHIYPKLGISSRRELHTVMSTI
jgi:DNA-binding CsgD family transcriptional regulator